MKNFRIHIEVLNPEIEASHRMEVKDFEAEGFALLCATDTDGKSTIEGAATAAGIDRLTLASLMNKAPVFLAAAKLAEGMREAEKIEREARVENMFKNMGKLNELLKRDE